MPSNESTQPSSVVCLFKSQEIYQMKYYSVTLWPPLMTLLNKNLHWKMEGYDSGSESLNIPVPLCRTLCLYHVSPSENLSFSPATPRTRSPHWPDNLNTVWHHLTFEEDDDSSIDSNTITWLPPHQLRWWGRTLTNRSTEWWCLDSWQSLMHPWKFTWSLPLPLPIQLGSATLHSRLYTYTSIHGPQQHL